MRGFCGVTEFSFASDTLPRGRRTRITFFSNFW
jgi:hypothetical protein